MPPLRLRFLLTIALLLSFAVAPLPSPGQEAVLEIRQILIEGNRMVEESTVRSRIGSHEGSPFDPDQVSSDVRDIYDLGYFENIRVNAVGFEGGLSLTFELTEKPIVRSITFDGNDKLSDSDLREKLEFTARTIYSPTAVAAAKRQLEEAYRAKGYYQVAIETSTEPAAEGEVVLVFLIDEGRKHSVSSITFTGNEVFSEGTLRKQMQTKRYGLFSWLTGSGRLLEDALQEDRQRILNFYHDNGYLEARVGNPQVSVNEKESRLEIGIAITEGGQFRLGSLSLTGDTLVPLDLIKETIVSREGEVFSRATFSRDLYTINGLYTEKGYAYTRVDYSSELKPEERLIDVTIFVDKKEQATIGRIVITGNVTTRDKVIRRNITIKEGDLFNSAELRKSRRKIINLGFFETVDIVPRPREEGVIDIDIELKEKLTGALSFGVGYSSEDKLAGQIRLSESNLLGRGQSLQLMGEFGAVRQSYSIAFNEPAIFDSRYSFGFRIYDTRKEYDEYDRRAVGGSLTLGRSIGEYYRGFITGKRETVDIKNVSEEASSLIREQEGKATTNSLELTLVRDSRDNYFNPTTGNRTVLSFEYAGGPLGGDNYFTKTKAESAQYFPLWWKLVFMQKARIGYVDGFEGREPPIYEKFFIGGIYSVRGFEPRSIGPVDENGDPLGGYTELVFNSEVSFPLNESEGLNLVIFFDAGNTWDKGEKIDPTDLRTGAGLGIRWLSPMGPFRLEWGWNLKPREGEEKGDWAFTIGAFF